LTQDLPGHCKGTTVVLAGIYWTLALAITEGPVTEFKAEIRWDDHTLLFTFETPLTQEQRQQLAQLVAKSLGLLFEDSYESYSLVVDTDTDEQYLRGNERFVFNNSHSQQIDNLSSQD
jgi:hypothetical protein